MLVVNGDRRGIPPTERIVLDWLRTWNGAYKVCGVAISGCYLPERRRYRRASEADLVVITPHACVVIEVKGITSPVSGVLSCPANGPWSMPGVAGSPVHARENDTNPLNQVRQAAFNLKNHNTRLGIDAFVSGLVLVIPHPGCSVTVAKMDLPTGIDILVGTQEGLRIWFQGQRRRTTSWTAEQAHRVLAGLNLGQAVAIDQLAAEGFASQQVPDPSRSSSVATSRASSSDLSACLEGVTVSPRSAVVDPPPRSPFRPTSHRTTLPPAWAPIAARHRQPLEAHTPPSRDEQSGHTDGRTPTYGKPAAPPRFPDPVVRPPRRTTRSLLALGLALAIIGGFAALVYTHPHRSAEGTPAVTESTPAETLPPREIPAGPAPEKPRTCYPLDPDC